MSRIYDPDLPLDANGKLPRGIYVPIRGVYFKYGTANHKAAKTALRVERIKRRNAVWKANAEAEAAGEYVFDPSWPFPEWVQRQLHEQGKYHPVFWRDLYKSIKADA